MRPPLYDIHKTYQENFDEGPFFEGPLPTRVVPPREEWVNFLGHPVACPLGVPAGPLLNSNWTTLAARLGFDIVTYKTIRSQFHPAHPLPNMVYVETHGMLSYARAEASLMQASSPPDSMETLAVTNSFGIPSQKPDIVAADIARAQSLLQEGQVLIVSVVGTPREGEDFVEDFVLCGRQALEGGAKIIEADLSCPNVTTKEGGLFADPEMVFTITSKMKQALGATPLIIKLGVIPRAERLSEVMQVVARGGAEAVCGINTMSMKLIDASGNPLLGPKRAKAGVCGSPIRSLALDFIHRARKINDQEGYNLTLMATGGACLPEHFDLFFDAGADVAMSAAGMMWDPYLAASYHEGGKQRWKVKSKPASLSFTK